jgi:hypothetical protein
MIFFMLFYQPDLCVFLLNLARYLTLLSVLNVNRQL